MPKLLSLVPFATEVAMLGVWVAGIVAAEAADTVNVLTGQHWLNYGAMGLFAMTLAYLLREARTDAREQLHAFQEQIRVVTDQFLKAMAEERTMRELHSRSITDRITADHGQCRVDHNSLFKTLEAIKADTTVIRAGKE